MRRLKKWQSITIIAASAVLILATIGITVWAVVFRQESIVQDYSDIGANFKPLDEWYVGNVMPDGSKTMTVNELFGKRAKDGAVYSSSADSVISISGEIATVIRNGETILTVTHGGNADEYKVKVIDGVNAFTYGDLLLIASQDKVICQQRDIRISDSLGTNGFKTIAISKDYFGNANKLISSSEIVNGYYSSVVSAEGENVTIKDLYIIGHEVLKGESYTLSDFGKAGWLISFDGGGNERPSGSIINCVLENAQRPVFINAAEVTLKGNYIRNAADACVSIESNNDGETKVTMENNVIYNAVVAGILSWCYKPNVATKNYAVIDIKGFLDIYNWKNIKNAQIMPESEGALAGMVNPMLPGELDQKKYEHYFLKVDKEKYIHCGLIVIATGDAKKNESTINGYNSVTYEKRDFPLPSIASLGMHYCVVYGYGAGNNPLLAPMDTPEGNKNLFEDLRNGR